MLIMLNFLSFVLDPKRAIWSDRNLILCSSFLIQTVNELLWLSNVLLHHFYFIYLFIYLFVYLFIYLFIYSFIYLFIYLFILMMVQL